MRTDISPEQWLEVAKSLPVGAAKRIRHGFEHRQNMVVRNRAGAWTAYCFACDAYARIHKEHAVRVEPIADPIEPPTDIVWGLDDLTQRCLDFLVYKGIDPELLRDSDVAVGYSAEAGRLIFKTTGHVIGRALLNQQPKWRAYKSPPMPVMVNKGCRYAVVLEDLLSAIKTGFVAQANALPFTAIWTEGTTPSQRKLRVIVEDFEACSVFYDGDKAGRTGTRKFMGRLRLYQKPCVAIPTTTGIDPKDYTEEALLRALRKALHNLQQLLEVKHE